MIRKLFWFILALTLADYAIMALWSLPHLLSFSGTPIFDVRFSGYSFEQARDILEALGPEGRAFYQNFQHPLDTAYPALLALSLGLAIFLLLPARWKAARLLLSLVPLPGMIFDYMENADVAALLRTGPDAISPSMVAAASRNTVLKAQLDSTALALLLIVAGVWAWRHFGPGSRPR